MAASDELLVIKPLLRSMSLPARLCYSVDDDFSEGIWTDDEDFTEETDGTISPMSASSPFSPVSREPLPEEEESRDRSKLTGPQRLLLQPSINGTFKYAPSPSPSFTLPSIPNLLSSKTNSSCTSCTDLTQIDKNLAKSQQQKLFKKWSRKSPNLHLVRKPKILSKLLQHPLANPNARNGNGDTPLHVYVDSRCEHRLELITILCSCGRSTDTNAVNESGYTPLHIAAMNDDEISTCALLAFGAEVRFQDFHKQTSYDIAVSKNYLKNLRHQLLEKLALRPGFVPGRDRAPTVPADLMPACTADMIGYYLGCRRETKFVLEMEKAIENILKEKELCGLDDAGLAGAAFLQWNHIIHWRKTKNRHSKPGNRVLFLDGGGVRGLVQLEILMEIERVTGRRITDLFDWIVGTSTGAIVALSLVYAGLSLAQTRDLFYQFCPQVFKKSSFGFWEIPQPVSNSLAMQNILMNIFRNKKMSDTKEPKILISAVDNTNSSLPVVFYNNYERNSPFSNISVWEVARMTSAAPIYFTDYKGYIDGGIKANNPCSLGMNKIREYYTNQNSPHFSIIVSIGTGVFPGLKQENTSIAMTTGIDGVKTVRNLFNLLTNAISTSDEDAKIFGKWCQTVNPKIPFFRFSPPFNEEIKTDETNPMLLVDMVMKTKQFVTSNSFMSELFGLVKIFKDLELDFQQ